MKEYKRKSALERLQQQLEEGVKTKKGTRDEKIPLTDKDVSRINREIIIIKNKLK